MVDDRLSDPGVPPQIKVCQQLARLGHLIEQLDEVEDAEDSDRGPCAPMPGWRDPPREKPRR